MTRLCVEETRIDYYPTIVDGGVYYRPTDKLLSLSRRQLVTVSYYNNNK